LLLFLPVSGGQAAERVHGEAATHPAGAALVALANIVHGREQAVVATFNTQMARQLSSAKLARDWGLYELVFGRYLGHGQPVTVSLPPLTVVRVPLKMARRPGEFRISYQPDGRVAGLYFLRS